MRDIPSEDANANYGITERDGGMMAVTLMSSDVGKLYAARATAVDNQR